MRNEKKLRLTLIGLIFLIFIAAVAWGDSEKEARRIYNEALILLDKHEALKAEKLLKEIISGHMDTSVATEAIRTLQMMKSLRIVEKYNNLNAKVDLHNLMTAIDDYHNDHKRYATSITQLEEYGFYVSDEGTTVSIIFGDDKKYVAKAFHERGDKIYLVKGPATFSAIHEIDKIDIDKYSDKDGNKRLSFRELEGFYRYPQKTQMIFVVKGMVINNYPEIRKFIRIRSNILDSKGNVVKSKTVYAGNPISDKELRSFSMKEIDKRLRNKFGKNRANANIVPLSAIPFTVVFNNLPEDISKFTVEAISSSSVGK